MTDYAFRQVDVFGGQAFKGNPLAVVIGADGLSDADMAAFANWTNLSETTFLLSPTRSDADYRVRIFTPWTELPFAGHPTLGSCHAWLASGGKPRGQEVIQECGVGLVRIRNHDGLLAFAAPALRRSGPLEPDLLAKITHGLGLEPDDIKASQWADNGPGWAAVMLGSRKQLLALTPDAAVLAGMKIGAVAPWASSEDETEAQFEVRAFVSGMGLYEDPVTGSLNAGLAQWLIGSGFAPSAYVASQGTALGRKGRVHVQQIGNDIWIGGETTTRIEGTATF